MLVRLGLTAVASLATMTSIARAQTVPPEVGRPVFLVTDVAVGEGVPIDKDAARDVLTTRFGRLKSRLELRSLAEARASVDAAAIAQLVGGGSDDDLARIEEYLKVDRLVLGRLAAVGGVVELQVKVFNVKEGVTEVAFARRLGRDADRAMVLALLDTLADSLLAWTLDHYTDGDPSAEAAALKSRKLGGRRPAAPATGTSPWGTIGVVGAAGAGLGAGVLGVGLYNAFADGDVSGIDIGLLAAGGVALVLGATAVSVDLGDGSEEAPVAALVGVKAAPTVAPAAPVRPHSATSWPSRATNVRAKRARARSPSWSMKASSWAGSWWNSASDATPAFSQTRAPIS